MTLPNFVRITGNSHFVWGDVDGNSFSSHLDQVYNEIVHWRRNIFLLPTGRSGKIFVSELSHLFNAYYPGFSLEGIALKAAMSLPILFSRNHSPNPNLVITSSVLREDSSCGCVVI